MKREEKIVEEVLVSVLVLVLVPFHKDEKCMYKNTVRTVQIAMKYKVLSSNTSLLSVY